MSAPRRTANPALLADPRTRPMPAFDPARNEDARSALYALLLADPAIPRDDPRVSV